MKQQFEANGWVVSSGTQQTNNQRVKRGLGEMRLNERLGKTIRGVLKCWV